MHAITSHLLALVVATALTVGVAYWVHSRGRGRAATLFTGVLLGSAGWTGAVAIETVLPTLELKVAAFTLVQLFSWSVPLLWLVFTLHYTGNEHLLTTPVKAALLGNHVLVVGLAVTNPVHNLLWRRYWLVAEPFPHLAREQTLLYQVELAVMYLYVVGGLVLLLKLFLVARRVSKTQPAALVLAALLPVLMNVGENAGLLPVPEFQYTAIGIGLVAVVAAWAMFGQRLFAVAPMARDVLLEQVDQAVIVVDDDLRVADFNRAAACLFPALGDALGGRLDDAMPGLVETTSSDDGQPDGLPFVDELTTYSDGTQRTLRVNATEIGATGSRNGYGLVLQDVTEISTYANQLEQQTDRLEQFAETVSHDLRNPLSVARGRVEIAKAEQDTAELDRATDALDRMDDIINDVLTLARDGNTIDERALVSLAAVATDAWETARTADATLTVDPVEDVAVYADRAQLRSALENLFRNAVDHGPDDVQIELVTTDDGFAVVDDGPGLPPDTDSLFEYGHTTADDGTGLGLAIVRSIAVAHGWTVEAGDGTARPDSSLSGACFLFSGVDLVDQSDQTHPQSRPSAGRGEG